MSHKAVGLLIGASLIAASMGLAEGQTTRPAPRTASNINDPYVREYLATLDDIDWLTIQKDLPGLQKLGDRIEAEWPGKNIKMYGYIMLQLVGHLQQTQFGSNEHFAVKAKFAQLALQKADRLPLEVETSLVPHLGDELYGGFETSDQAKEAQRIMAMGFWIHAINRAEAAVDPNWDEKRDGPQPIDLTQFRGPWPMGSGMSPDVITDPVVRQKYIAAIEERRRRAELVTQQITARRVKQAFLPRAENDIAKAYARTGQVPELHRLLAQVEIKQTRDAILSMVKTMQESENK